MIKIPALRSLVRIDTPLLQNSRRLLSYKLENQSNQAQNAPEEAIQSVQTSQPLESQAEASEPASVKPTDNAFLTTANSFRYNVCQPRTSPIDKSDFFKNHTSMHQNEAVKATIEEQHLQPAMLKEYFQQSMERNVLVNPDQDFNEVSKVSTNQSSYKRFQESKTHANATLPLKSVKLANPFPEPVKQMMSHTVSDSEKAQQALAESRSVGKFSDWGRIPTRSFSTTARMHSKTVGRDPEKCKKFAGGKKGCPKLKVEGCPAPARVKCDRLAKHIDCKKQLAPYPAYSEFCHEEVEEKPSECKLCPWKSEENPNFKPPKKHFHSTSFPLRLRRSGLELEQSELSSAVESASNSNDNSVEATSVVPEENRDGMQCDLRKGQCERPKNRRCPPTKEELKKKKEEERKKKKKKCNAVEDDEAVASVSFQQAQVEDLLEPAVIEASPKQKKKTPKKKPCKLPRFQFPKCEYPKRQEQTGKCPPKKKRPLVEDCPPCGKCTFGELDTTPIEGYQMKKDQVRKDRSKCPKVDMTVNPPEEDDDPCRLKRKGVTKICPADLLKRKRRKPKKPVQKHSEIVPPEPKKEPPKPSARIM